MTTPALDISSTVSRYSPATIYIGGQTRVRSGIITPDWSIDGYARGSVEYGRTYSTPPVVVLSNVDNTEVRIEPTTTGFVYEIAHPTKLVHIHGTSDDFGSYTSIRDIDGIPSIAYKNIMDADLKYVRAKNSLGTKWSSPITVDAPGDVGSYAVMRMMGSGLPAIAYADDTEIDLKYAYADDVDGTSWNTVVVDATPSEPVTNISIKIVNGNPAIVYRLDSVLTYIRATDATGTAWGTPVSIDIDDGPDTHLLVVGGRPAISYHKSSPVDPTSTVVPDSGTSTYGAQSVAITLPSGAIGISYTDDEDGTSRKFISSTNSFGDLFNDPVTVQSNVGTSTLTPSSISIVSDNPAVAYGATGDVMYARATNAAGTAWSVPVVAAVAGTIAPSISMQVVDGNPTIAFHDDSTSTALYVRSTDSIGSAWGTPQLAASNVSGFVNLIVTSGGLPSVFFVNAVTNEVAYVRATNIAGTAWSAPADITSNRIDALVGIGAAIINGNPAIAYHAQGDRIRYIRSDNAAGTGWTGSFRNVIPNYSNESGEVTLKTIGGLPTLIATDTDTDSITLVQSQNIDGNTWGTRIEVDTSIHDPVGGILPAGLCELSSNPAVTYRKNSTMRLYSTQIDAGLKYVRSNDVNGTSWLEATTAVSGEVGQFSSMAVTAAGVPIIVYYNPVIGLRYTLTESVAGDTWLSPVTIDSDGDVGQYVSMRAIDGILTAVYHDATNTSIKLVRATDPQGTVWGAPITLDAGIGVTGQYTSIIDIDSTARISYVYEDAGGISLKYAMYVPSPTTSIRWVAYLNPF